MENKETKNDSSNQQPPLPQPVIPPLKEMATEIKRTLPSLSELGDSALLCFKGIARGITVGYSAFTETIKDGHEQGKRDSEKIK